MKTLTELEALTNAVNSVGLPHLKVYEQFFQDKRKKTPRYFLQLGSNTLSPILNYENMNHFILGFSKAKKIIHTKLKHMKKLSISLIMIIIWCNASAQVFTGLNLASNGAGLSIGAESNNIAFTVLMSHPYRNSEQDGYYAMQVGKIVPLGEDKGYIIGLHAGAAYCNKKVIKDEVTQLTTFKGIYTAEIGRNMGTGRLSLICNYVGGISYGFSMKVFF